ncbi:MAG TPA: choice-of-anchor D domain-containing protein [Acidimicrobiales bacterium]|nr:choice-of-anchor D domain-containing protein [Acidimicrobiales bacterium]
MNRRRSRRAVVAVTALIVVTSGIVATGALAGSPPNVITGAYDNLRSGWDPNEPNLSPSDVQSASFGQVFTRQLKGSVYAQPLVVNGTVIVTTEKARAYGLNATTGKVQWRRHFGKPLLSSTISCGDLTPDLGSTSTPVVDPSTDTIYMTVRLQKGKGAANNHTWMEAISAATGKNRPGFPVEISGTPDNTPGVPFAGASQLQRPALLLLGGVVYAAFSSDCDNPTYRGIVVGVSTTTHSVTTMWSDEAGAGTSPNSQAGIWQSGGGIVSDGPNRIFVTTGNGIAPPPSAGTDPPPTLSESVVALTIGSNGKLTPTDYFAPSNAPTLDQNDQDFGSGGPIALPSAYFGTSSDPNLLIQDGKDGRIYLLDRDNLGGRSQGPGGTDDPLQLIGPFNGLWGHPAVYGGEGGWVYIAESTGGGVLRALSYGVTSGGVPQFTSAGTSTGALGYSSGSPTVTSNGTTAGSAVVWLVYAGGTSGAGAQLRAYGAIPSGGTLPLLWSAPIGTASKFSDVTAANGMVYVGTRTGLVYAFGTKSNAPLQAAPVDFGRVPVGTAKTENVTVTATRSTAITGVTSPVGVQNVSGLSGRIPANTGAGFQGSTGASGTAPLDPQTPEFSVRVPRHRHPLAPGQSLTIPVTFTPRSAGTVVADITVTSTTGSRTLALTGYGTAPGLILSAPPVSFGVLDTGAGGKTLTFTVANSWDRPETITAVTSATAPFTVTGLPHLGTVLEPQQAVTVSVAYDPTAPGTDDQFITVTSDHGAVSEPLTGAAVTGTAVLALTPSVLNFGSVPVGRSVTLTFHIDNTGNIPLTISRAAAPSGVFSADRPLPEGITLDPDTGVSQAVTFTPTASGSFSGRYTFGAENGHGTLAVTFSGVGTP